MASRHEYLAFISIKILGAITNWQDSLLIYLFFFNEINSYETTMEDRNVEIENCNFNNSSITFIYELKEYKIIE